MTHPLHQEHTDEIVSLSWLVDGYTRETRQEDLVDSLMVENFVGRKSKAVGDRGHDLLSMLVV